MMTQYIVFVGAAIHLFGSAHYIKDTLRGTTKPNRVSFIMWAAAPIIGGFAAIAEGVTFAVVPVFMAGIIPLLIFFASFVNKEAYWKLKTFDYLSGFLSVVALMLWWITDEPIVAIVFALLSDILASLPTITKSWTNPETETGIAYITAIISSLTSFFAIQVWGFTELAFPIYLVLQNALIGGLIYRKKKV